MDQGSLVVQVVYHWARGVPFKDICQLTDVLEGSIVRTIVRLDETCRCCGFLQPPIRVPTRYIFVHGSFPWSQSLIGPALCLDHDTDHRACGVHAADCVQGLLSIPKSLSPC